MFVEADSGCALGAICLIVLGWPYRRAVRRLCRASSYLFDIMVI